MRPLPKNYDHQQVEKKWQEYWVANGTYHFGDDLSRDKTFVIDTPPPTVSGHLHMGHIFSYTQADFIARFQRMNGKDVFYPMGFDDNGLPTERLVEQMKEIRGSTMPRAEFVAHCKEVVVEAENAFRRLFKSAALSVDWRYEYQTINDNVQAISQASFLDLLAKGEAYRDFRPTYWDWVDQTAIASAEIENKELPGVMNELKFAVVSGQSSEFTITIMTTRPELLGACVAVMYHPEDANAAKYKNAFAITPLFGDRVPMIADEAVDRDKGTGLVMCCTFGDDTDKEWWRKYKLPLKAILGKDGRFDFTNHQPSTTNQLLQGLKPKQANAKIIELLKECGALTKQTPMTHTVKCAERSGTPIEIIPTSQWFVRLIDKKPELLAKAKEVRWWPEHMRIRIEQWTEGLKEDWCISRQRFFGVPFPIWYSKRAGEEGKIIAATIDMLPIDPTTTPPPGYRMDEVTPDVDVMDTWATSSLTPQISAGGILLRGQKAEPAMSAQSAASCESQQTFTEANKKLFPADLRPQAHEIIRSWAFYTIAKAHLHSDSVPWKNIMISGWCLAADKTKMSKSKGNVVTPVALIEEKGTDAVRYWASTSRLATDTAFSEDLLKIGRKLVGKIWNASNFIAQLPAPSTMHQAPSEALDQWILSRLHQCVKKSTQAFEAFEYCDARVAIEDFFWNDFCDNYLELVKARAYGESGIGNQESALYTLSTCLDAILRLFAPFVPHVTEEIYSHLFEGNGSVHARGKWPKAADYPYDAEAELAGFAAVDILNVVRKVKSEAGVSIKTPVADIIVCALGDAPNSNHVQRVSEDIKSAANTQLMWSVAVAEMKEGIASDKGWFKVRVTLAKPDEEKTNSPNEKHQFQTNPKQAEHEKLEGEIVYAPGAPDMSKHVVKVQVSSLPETLERKR